LLHYKIYFDQSVMTTHPLAIFDSRKYRSEISIYWFK